MAGQPQSEFGAVSMREMQIILDASALRDAQVAWQAAQYVAYAYHDPKKMPECPGEKKPENVNTKADAAYVRAWMKAMSSRSRGANGS